MRRFWPLLLLVPTACATAQSPEPSLAPRAAEAIDPRVPIPSEAVVGPVDPALASRLSGLMAQVRQGDAVFQAASDDAARVAAAAGPAASESWVEAQQAVSALVAARAPVTQAIADLDALTAERIQAGGILPGDLAAIQAASLEANAINRSETETMDRLQAQLAR